MIATADLWSRPCDLVESASELVSQPIHLIRMLELNRLWHSALPNLPYRTAQWGDLVEPLAISDGQGGVYAVSLVTRPIAANRMRWPLDHLAELRRLAVAPYAPKFTATRSLRLIRQSIKSGHPDICTLVSYQATDVHSGTIYKADNWTRDDPQTYQGWASHGDSAKAGAMTQQNTSPKVRWRYQLRQCHCADFPDRAEAVADDAARLRKLLP